MKWSLLAVTAAAFSAAACAGQGIEHASIDQRASHNQLYTVSAEPVIVDERTGWVSIKMEINSTLGTDSVAFNVLLK